MGDGSALRDGLSTLGEGAASGLGWVVGGVMGAAGVLRRGKPLHPTGLVYEATLTTWGRGRRWGVPLLDQERETRCRVRLSRATGLPEPLPDIHGVAVRLDGEPVDLLFATTGTGRLTRYVLLLRRSGAAAMTTLMPLRTSAGPLQLRLSPQSADDGRRAWVVSAGSPGSPRWVPFGRLVTAPEPVGPDPDPPVRYDPVRNIPAGTGQYRGIALLRDPAYVVARRWSPPSRWRRRPHA